MPSNRDICRLKADWLVGINATRLFSVLYGQTLNIGRVMSPTLAMIVQREAEIAAFEPKPFYTVELSCGGMTLTGERFLGKRYTEAVADFCADKPVTIQAVERRERSEKAPALYDLTALQREANRVLGYTAQHTHDSFSQKDSTTSQLTGNLRFNPIWPTTAREKSKNRIRGLPIEGDSGT